ARPRFLAVQAENCAAFAAAWAAAAPGYVPFSARPAAADGIATVKPVRTEAVLAALRRSQGGVVAVPEAEIAPALVGLGRLALFVEPTAATAAAAPPLLLRQAAIQPHVTVAAVLTDHGLKTTDKTEHLLGVTTSG